MHLKKSLGLPTSSINFFFAKKLIFYFKRTFSDLAITAKKLRFLEKLFSSCELVSQQKVLFQRQGFN